MPPTPSLLQAGLDALGALEAASEFLAKRGTRTATAQALYVRGVAESLRDAIHAERERSRETVSDTLAMMHRAPMLRGFVTGGGK